MTTVNEIISQRIGNVITNSQTWGGVMKNVASYGAVGDGVTDDTESVQAAIDAAIAAGGKLVFFPHGSTGVYKVTALTSLSSVILSGDNASFSGISTTISQFGDMVDSVLTGYVSGAGTVAATDTILEAIQKLNGNQVAHESELATDDTPPHGMGSAAALDEESGMWTPVLIGSTVAGTHTYMLQVGNYYRIGKMIICRFQIQLSALDDTATGNAQITGLPFAMLSDYGGAAFTRFSVITFSTGYTQLLGYGTGSTLAITQVGSTKAVANVSITNFSDTSSIIGMISYVTL